MKRTPRRPSTAAWWLGALLCMASTAGTAGALDDGLRVQDVRGEGSAQRGTERRALRPDDAVAAGELLEVGPRSRARLVVGTHALLELGSNARLVVQSENDDMAPLRLRLERGFLRIVGSSEAGDALPVLLSAGRWTAYVESGEYFFESSSETVSACTPNGSIRWSGRPEWTPTPTSTGCVQLAPGVAPRAMALREQDWDAPRRHPHLLSKLVAVDGSTVVQTIAQASPPDPQALLEQDPPAAGPAGSPAVRRPSLRWATSLQDHLR